MGNFYVIDHEDNTLWEGKNQNDAPQRFDTFDEAEERAKKAAISEPGKEFKVVGILAVVSCPIRPPETRKVG